MNNKSPQKEKDYRGKLRQLAAQPGWKILLFTLAVHSALLWQAIIDYYYYLNFNFLFARRAFFKRTLQRAHWVGQSIQKPHRLAFLALAGLLLAGAVTAPYPLPALYWQIAWGGIFSIFVTVKSIALILQRVRA